MKTFRTVALPFLFLVAFILEACGGQEPGDDPALMAAAEKVNASEQEGTLATMLTAEDGESLTGIENTAVPFPGVFRQKYDNVHISSDATIDSASGHGWWENIEGPGGIKARVTVQLQARTSTSASWRNVGALGSKIVYSGGGRGQRATAQKVCTNLIQRVYWRSVIDVDLIDYKDSPDKSYSPQQMLYCGAW